MAAMAAMSAIPSQRRSIDKPPPMVRSGRLGAVREWLLQSFAALLGVGCPYMATLTYEAYYLDVTGLEREYLTDRPY